MREAAADVHVGAEALGAHAVLAEHIADAELGVEGREAIALFLAPVDDVAADGIVGDVRAGRRTAVQGVSEPDTGQDVARERAGS